MSGRPVPDRPEVVIDLGVVGDRPVTDAPPAPGGGPRGGWPPGLLFGPVPRAVRLRRGLLAAALLVVLAGPGAPLPRPLSATAVPARLGDSVVVTEQRLYVIRADMLGMDSTPRTLTAYRLPGAGRAWQATLPVPGQPRDVIEAAGVLLASFDRPQTGTAAESTAEVETLGLDLATGRLRWRLPYRIVAPLGGGQWVLMAEGAIGVNRLTTVDAMTGRVLWTREMATDGWQYLDAGGPREQPRLITVQPPGKVTVRDPCSGQVLGTGDLFTLPSGGEGLQLAGDVLLASQVISGRSSVTAYSVDTLRQRWSIDENLAAVFVSADCAGQLCFQHRSGGLRVVDPATGHTRWQQRDWDSAETLGDVLLVHAWRSSGEGSVAALLDPLTGRRLLDLGHWRVLGPGGAVPEAAPVLVARTDPQRNRIWFGQLDAAGRAVRMLGTAGGVSGDCQAGGGAVVCRRPDATLAVWRLPQPG